MSFTAVRGLAATEKRAAQCRDNLLAELEQKIHLCFPAYICIVIIPDISTIFLTLNGINDRVIH